LANAYNRNIKDILNIKIKKRDSFQPFCPSILESDRVKLFEDSYYSPFMSSVFMLKKENRTILSSISHIN
jgi:carbamoyltransferase